MAEAQPVVYSSIPDLTVNPDINAWCSSCSGSWEPLDNFTLSNATSIGGFNLVTQTGYGDSSNFTIDIFNSNHTNILFSQNVTSTPVSNTDFNTTIVTGSLSGLNLAAGSYWIGFDSYNMATPGFYSGGNGSLIDSQTPHSGSADYIPGGNIGYQLLGASVAAVPEPESYAMLLAGLGLMGFMVRRKKNA
jgi:hypothetical protein